MFDINAFISSFLLYTLLRYFDVVSTGLCLADLDPEMHEVNPIVAPLIKKIGFYKTMLVTWVPFATLTGLMDTLYVYPIVGIPVLWLVFGLFHLIATANNFQLYFQKQIFGTEVIAENTRRIIKMLKGLSTLGKVTFLIKTNFLNLFFTFYGVAALILFQLLLSTMDIYIKGPIPILLVVGPPIMILDLIMFFPILVFGSLIISLRRLRIVNDEDIHWKESPKYLTVSVECLQNVLREAQAGGANCVQFLVPSDE